MKKRVLMAMSGGIDSSVAAILLQQQDYELVGVTFRNFDLPCKQGDDDTVVKARQLAEKLGFEHHELDVREAFHQTVIRNFIDEYLCCRTPNPCVVCNKAIKWGMLMQFADEQNCDLLATGHYAQVACENGRHFVRKGKDVLKDQSYFLWKISDEYLKRTLFPLGGLTKQEVKEIAAQHGFVKLSEQKESEDICFLPDNNYREFLQEHVPNLSEVMRPGKFVDVEGKVVGKHSGLYNYTIGQRKGLGIALGVPAYVVSLDARRNRVVVGSKEDLQGDVLFAKDVNMVKYADFVDGQTFDCRIRYRSKGVPAQLFHDELGVRVAFLEKVESITPGQSVVFYEGDDIVGGGVIV